MLVVLVGAHLVVVLQLLQKEHYLKVKMVGVGQGKALIAVVEDTPMLEAQEAQQLVEAVVAVALEEMVL